MAAPLGLEEQEGVFAMSQMQHVEVPRHEWSDFCQDFGRRYRGRGVEVSTGHEDGRRRVVVADASLSRLRLIHGRVASSLASAPAGSAAPELRVSVQIDEERGGVEFSLPVQLRLFSLVNGTDPAAGLRVEMSSGGAYLDLRLMGHRAAPRIGIGG